MNEYIAALVDEFYQLGVRHAVFSPGSRSTTMAMLFTEYEGFETYMNIDERSASFMALGIAKAHKEPTVLVCTSGSAVAHYLPAILEAQYSGVPLIVLSADRPYTLLHTGAPQTVDQQKIFGTAVNYYEELSVPQDEHYYTYPRQVARKAYMKAMDTKKGPVHINIPLFEPLVPELDRKHFEAGRSPYKVFKPNYGDVFSYQNRSNNTSNASNTS
ncbi:MAG: 2-succinyl-5-enolpyruvyl-6-hydroxy-3-cyclohexene-1-carboxylic-acid synthase, partial [Veillonella parvula]